jgi:geranylgeranyl diphosphate synthase type II
MDDDDLRRGRPTNHKVFGEAMAILAGDGLLTYAFEVAADNARLLELGSAQCLDLIQTLARGAGTQGMVAGQVADLEAEDWQDKNHGFDPAKALRSIHERKTAALIAASLESGAILAKAGKAERSALSRYGRLIGLAFQIADDVLDVIGDKKKLGKTGSDRENNKLTYASLFGVDQAQKQALELIKRAHETIFPLFGTKGRVLDEMADHIVARDR